MSENSFEIRYNLENGGVESMVNAADPYAMNWLGVNNTWGTVKNANVVSVTPTENGFFFMRNSTYLSGCRRPYLMLKNCSGSMAMPFFSTPKCRCAPVEIPELPT